ncbi:serine hydrolase domain-containing protein [Actinomycetospora atypica]|uniref:Serine hydrolase domain-containing protein n=1 Tax=Actinomycetospora atypica TaxID=1290095 RepID=A0ABV9YMA5_9PSEU
MSEHPDRFAEVAAAADVPGLVALAARGDDVRVEVHGDARRDTQFRIASITKPVVAAVVGMLLDEGALALDEPVDRLLPELADRRVLRAPDAALDDTVPAVRPISVRDVLTYTTGYGMTTEMFAADPPWPLVDAMTSGRLNIIGPPEPDVPPDPDTWVAEFARLPLLAQPGDRWLYHASGQLLGVLAARAAGTTLPELLHRRVFEPLGMTDTGFTGDPARLATAYSGDEVWDPPAGRWSRPPAFPDAAAGLVSTADDLLAFARSLSGRPPMTRDQLSAEQRATAQASGFLGDEALSWGYGVSVTVDGPRAGSFGWAGGLGTSWTVDPVRDLVVVVLTQKLFAGPTDLGLHTALVEAAYAR